MLRARIVGTEPNCGDILPRSSWHVPESQTLSISTNIETKKTRVVQSMFFTTSFRLLLSNMGEDESRAIQLKLKSQAGKNSTRRILHVIRDRRRKRAFFEISASSGSEITSSEWIRAGLPNSLLKKSLSTA